MPEKNSEKMQAVTFDSRFPDLSFLPNDHRWPEMLHSPATYDEVTTALERLSIHPPEPVEQIEPLELLNCLHVNNLEITWASEGLIHCKRTDLGTFNDRGIDYIFNPQGRIAAYCETQSGHRIAPWTEFRYDDEGHLMSKERRSEYSVEGTYFTYANDEAGNKKVSQLKQVFWERQDPIIVDLDGYQEQIDSLVTPYDTKEKEEVRPATLQVGRLRSYNRNEQRVIEARINQAELPEHFALDLNTIRDLLALAVTNVEIEKLTAEWRQGMPQSGIGQRMTLWHDKSLDCSVELTLPSFAEEMLTPEFNLSSFFQHDAAAIWGPSPRSLGKPVYWSWPEISVKIGALKDATPERLAQIEIIEKSMLSLIISAQEAGAIKRVNDDGLTLNTLTN